MDMVNETFLETRTFAEEQLHLDNVLGTFMLRRRLMRTLCIFMLMELMLGTHLGTTV